MRNQRIPIDHFSSFVAGEERGFNHYFRAYYKPLLNFAIQIVQDSNIAEDALQDSFIRLFEKRHSIASEGGIKPYLYTSVKNNCLNRLRRQKHHHSYIEHVKKSPEDFSPDITGKIVAAEVMIELRRAIERLPPIYRHLVTEIYFAGRRIRAIASEMELSQTTVKSRKAKALKILREDLN
jgi:RNA polymerase sigma-70 factor, ECF subfamily